MARKSPPTIKEIFTIIDQMTNRAEREIARQYVTALEETRLILSKLYEKYAKEGILTHAEMTKYNRLIALHDDLVKTLGPTLSKNGKVVINLAKDSYEASYFRMGWQITENAGVAGRWGLISPKLVEIAVNKPYSGTTLAKVWTRAKASALSDIKRAVVQGTVQGDSYVNMARRVKKVFDTNTKRAMKIAQTEGHRLAVEGQKDAYDRAGEMGIEVKQIWDATLDERTRPDHRAMDGKAAENVGTEDEPHWQWNFPGVGWVDGPGLTGDPSQDINCRCRVTGEIKGFEPTARISRDVEGRNQFAPYQTYEEWAEVQGIK